MTDIIALILLILLVMLVIDLEQNQTYYDQCLHTQHHSYLRCFYDHVLRIN